MDDATKIITALFGGIVVIAIAAVIVGQKSQAPQAIQSIGSAVGSVVAAAVNPVSAHYGYGNGSSTFSTPSTIATLGSTLDSFAIGAPVVPGGSK